MSQYDVPLHQVLQSVAELYKLSNYLSRRGGDVLRQFSITNAVSDFYSATLDSRDVRRRRCDTVVMTSN